jgi:hypothetical protein
MVPRIIEVIFLPGPFEVTFRSAPSLPRTCREPRRIALPIYHGGSILEFSGPPKFTSIMIETYSIFQTDISSTRNQPQLRDGYLPLQFKNLQVFETENWSASTKIIERSKNQTCQIGRSTST